MIQLETQNVFSYKYFNIAKLLMLFQDAVTNFSPTYVKYIMDRGINQGHGNNISRLSASFMITMTQLKFKNY